MSPILAYFPLRPPRVGLRTARICLGMLSVVADQENMIFNIPERSPTELGFARNSCLHSVADMFP